MRPWPWIAGIVLAALLALLWFGAIWVALLGW